MAVVVKRFDVYLVSLDPTVGVEIQKTRPCLIISPDEMNTYIQTVLIAPMTTKARHYPTRVTCRFDGKDSHIVLDQLRTVDKARLIKHMGRISPAAQKRVLGVLAELFAE
ncbi:MAG: type II toxin-antitoxin system PemK/MazF family toxin [Roseiflexaceae bacterium]